MKNAQGVFLDGLLYLGGGYTGSSRTDVTVHAHNFTSGKWFQLPPCPVKWSALTVLGNRLVLISGREASNNKLTLCSNKIAVWNSQEWKWECTVLPSMTTPRLSPVAISHRGHLIVAGGNKGSLDFHAEVLPQGATRWTCGPPLPLPCLPHTSATLDGVWYLLDLKTGTIQHANISAYMKTVRKVPNGVATDGDEGHTQWLSNGTLYDSRVHDLRSNLWASMHSSPPVIPFRIASTKSHLLAFSEAQGLISTHVYEQETWSSVESRLPSVLNSGLVLAGPGAEGEEGDKGKGESVLYVIGGQKGVGYSNSTYRLTLMTHADLRLVKKSRQTTLSLSE